MMVGTILHNSSDFRVTPEQSCMDSPLSLPRDLHNLASLVSVTALRWHVLKSQLTPQTATIQEVTDFEESLDALRNQIRDLMKSTSTIGSIDDTDR
jgi:hypothetical protein